MGRRKRHPELRVYQNNHLLGVLQKEPSGAIAFRYDEAWLARTSSYPVSLSLPLREEPYRGEPVIAVFENLLPDKDSIRRRVAEKVGATGSDAYSLLSVIGRDCVGALQFATGDEIVSDTTAIEGEAVSDEEVQGLLKNLVQSPLGLDREDDFRISIAGAQEKTALLLHEGRWLKPHGTTATTHIFKTQIGQIPNGIDLSNSVENEFYCLRLIAAFGLPTNAAVMRTFGDTKALVVERFDRRWTHDGRLLRLPQEDCCQALSIAPTRKYESDGGPGISQIVKLLRGSDTPAEDQRIFFKAQILFWLIGATDGHAKNFSIFLSPGGGFRLTPLYDILTAQPSFDDHQIERKKMKLAMCVGSSRHYRVSDIHLRHFLQSGENAGLPGSLVRSTIDEIADSLKPAMEKVEAELPSGFPEQIHESVKKAMASRAEQFSRSFDG